MTQAIVNEICSVKKFFDARPPGCSSVVLQKTMAESVLAMIDHSRTFGCADGIAVEEALKDADQAFGAHLERIRSGVEAKLTNYASSTKGLHIISSKDKQNLKFCWNLCTASDWRVLCNLNKSWVAKQTCLIERVLSVGLRNPDEHTIGWMMALLLLVSYNEMPSPRLCYDKLQDFKQDFEVESKKPWPLEFLSQYPEEPIDLPKNIFDRAFPNTDDPPVKVDFQGYMKSIFQVIPLRCTSKLLKPNATHPNIASLFRECRSCLPTCGEVPNATDGASSQVGVAIKAEHAGAVTKKEPSCLEPPKAQEHRAQTDTRPSDTTKVLVVQRDASGKLTLVQSDSTTVPNTSPPCPSKHSVPRLEDLDPYAKAAIDALSARNEKKNEEGKKKKKKLTAETATATLAKKADAAAEKDTAKEAKKTAQAKTKAKGARAAKKTKGEQGAAKKTKAKKTKAAKQTTGKAERRTRKVIEIPRSKILSAMPTLPKNGDNPPPVNYRGGVIYTSLTCKRFRALIKRGDKYSEVKPAPWKKPKPTQEAWKAVVRRIDAGK